MLIVVTRHLNAGALGITPRLPVLAMTTRAARLWPVARSLLAPCLFTARRRCLARSFAVVFAVVRAVVLPLFLSMMPAMSSLLLLPLAIFSLLLTLLPSSMTPTAADTPQEASTAAVDWNAGDRKKYHVV